MRALTGNHPGSELASVGHRDIRGTLADSAVRQGIQSFVGRRVPAQEVADVVHTVLCDALEADDSPATRDVPRWLHGIVRHKVADHHRRARTHPLATVDASLVGDRAAPLEARSLLRSVLADATRDPHDAQTMGWIAREAAGERFAEIAREASLPAATVRKRVSRLRRWLRKRWRAEAMLVLAAALTALGVALHRPSAAPVGPIVADPVADSSAAAGAALQGRWRFIAVEPDPSVAPPRRALIDGEARTTVVDVTGSVLRVTSASHHGERRLEVGPVTGGRFEIRVVDAGGFMERAWASFDGRGRLVLSSTEGSWRGRAVLERAEAW
jgi:DNA-directed RNA polymerase specialized sigma24 family protein